MFFIYNNTSCGSIKNPEGLLSDRDEYNLSFKRKNYNY